jgi:PKD repeat protein
MKYIMNKASAGVWQILIFCITINTFTGIPGLRAQQIPDFPDQVKIYHDLRAYDSVIAARIPVMKLPPGYSTKSLPVAVDNSQYFYFPGILDQHNFFTCQQYAGVAYTYAYERNRLLNKQGDLPANRFPPHYTWAFMNGGDPYSGVSFFYSFQVLKEQGHMTLDDYGVVDTITGALGWINGYDNYLRGMDNRIKAVYSVPINTEEGVLTLKHYLNDHLDGSSEGGVACFSARSTFESANVRILPTGTPEAGKEVIIAFYPLATHGMTIVGYNDSIRYDLNGDGLFTNDIDITNDGKVDVRDWEIGAYRMANSFGTWWSDKGFCYILYRAMALPYDYAGGQWWPDRGIWNNCVYIVEPDTGYKPRLTMKVKITHNSRNKIRIKAGISSDTTKLFPEHVVEFPFINFQGGDHLMQGFDVIPEGKTIELGFDITPLLSYTGSGEIARFFLIVEEKDSMNTGEGFVNQCSFIDYTNGIHEMIIPQTDSTIRNNTLTILSTTGTINFDKVHITTENLPANNPSQPCQVQLAASGGKEPFQWTLMRSYEKIREDSLFSSVSQQRLQQNAPTIPYTRIELPFSFPFYGQKYDSIYVNFYGFISFDKEQLPYPYLTDEEGMLKRTKIISPAFYMNSYYGNNSYGVWVESLPGRITIRWETGDLMNNAIRFNFALRLYPTGEFEFLYGDFIDVGSGFVTYSGYSGGDEMNFDVWTNWNSALLSNRSYRFGLQQVPSEISLTKEGMLNIVEADTGYIYAIPVQVTDADKISARKSFSLSTGLSFTQEIVCGDDHSLKYGVPAHFRLSLLNIGNETLQDIKLKLVAGDSSLILSDSLVTVPLLGPGSSLELENAFTFQLRHPHKDLYPIDLTIIASTSKHLWHKQFNVPVSAPEIIVMAPEIIDGYDGLLDPGEVADLVIPVQNVGSLSDDNVEVHVSTSDTFVNIVSQSFQTIDRINSFAGVNLHFQVNASRNAPVGHHADMLLTLTDHQLLNEQIPFTMVLGKMPVAIICLSSHAGSATAMKTALDSLQVPYEFLTELPSSIDLFSSLFISLGTSTGSYTLSQVEAFQLSGYLDKGGKIYMEGYPTWHYQKNTPLHPYFKYTTQKVPAYAYYEVEGVTGLFTDSMAFIYQNNTYYALFNYTPVAPAFGTFTNSDSIPKCVQIAYDGDDYKTIGSLLEFGSLIDGEPPSKKSTLMRHYLDFLNVAVIGPKVFFHSSKNSVCPWNAIDFTDDSFDNIESWQWEFPGGTPSASTARNPSVYYIVPGSYDVKLTVSDGVHSRSITKKNFVTVNECSGIPESASKAGLSVYPNPAKTHIYITFPEQLKTGSKLYIFDLLGRKVMERNVNSVKSEREILVDVSSLPNGLYIIKLISGSINVSTKVLIE